MVQQVEVELAEAVLKQMEDIMYGQGKPGETGRLASNPLSTSIWVNLSVYIIVISFLKVHLHEIFLFSFFALIKHI
jgi:hypothetical protein